MILQFLHGLPFFFLFHVFSIVRCTEQGYFYNTTITLSGEVGTCSSCSPALLSVPTFGCISSNGQNNTLYFEDYLPPTGVVVEYVNISFIGTLDCSQNGVESGSVSDVYLTLDGELVGSAVAFESQACNSSTCNNCMNQYSVAQQASNIRLGWPNFNYGGLNEIEVIVTSGTICIRQLTISYYYTWSFQPAVISLISPNLGPTTGGTLILLKGSSFMPGMLCKFGELSSVAMFVDSSTLYCVSPMTEIVRPVNLTLTLSEGSSYTPISKSTVQGVSLTNIASTIPNTFYYYENPSVSSFEPTEGIAGTEITVQGSNFTNYTTLSCMFGTTISDAFFISGTSVICVVPVLLNSSKVQIGISYNANEYVYASKEFNYQTTPTEESNNFLESNESWLVIVGCFILFISLVVGIFIWNKKTRNRNGYAPVQSWSAPYGNSQSNEEIQFSDLKFGAKIGRGSAGDVYKATWCGTAVAVKVLPSVQNADNQSALLKEDQLLKEAALMKSLRHPNVLQFLGACTKPDVCIVTEYMSLGSLYQQIHNPKVNWTWSLVKKIAIDASRGFWYLHNCKPSIIHRDLKSHNLLVDRSWKVKVCDFGMSRILDAQHIMTACGTPCWTAPEVLRKQQYNESADIYSLGIVFWELVTREDPYLGMDAYQVVFAVATQGIRPTIPPGCSAAFAQLITDCWEEEPQNRPKIDQVLQRLECIEFSSSLPSITLPNDNNV